MADQVEKGDQGKSSPHERINMLFDGDPGVSSNAGSANAQKIFESPAFALGPYSSPARTAWYSVTSSTALVVPGQTNASLFQFWQCRGIVNSLPDPEPDLVHHVKLKNDNGESRHVQSLKSPEIYHHRRRIRHGERRAMN